MRTANHNNLVVIVRNPLAQVHTLKDYLLHTAVMQAQ
jgi:hypothetical protein